MNPVDSKKRPSKSKATSDAPNLGPVSAAAAVAAGVVDGCGSPQQQSGGPVPNFLAAGAHAARTFWSGSPSGSSEWLYPPGGFMNFMQGTRIPPLTQPHPYVNYPNGCQLAENFHFIGAPMGHSTMSPTAACSKGTPSPTGSSAVDAAQMVSPDKETINVVDDDTMQPARSNVRPEARSDRRLNWSNEEDIRLVSAWLHNSMDPIDGNDRKSDQYWYDVMSTYNSTTKCDCIRNRNQLKLRWERIKKPVTEFNGCYTRISKVHQSCN